MTATPALPDLPPTSARRMRCADCLRPQRACICHWVRPVTTKVHVLILQHPLEVHHAKGSARLLHLSLPHSRLLVGETFDPAVLGPLLQGAPQPASGSDTVPSTDACSCLSLLLYPDTADNQATDLVPTVLWAPDPSMLPAQIQLVVLDATWRKSRKMLYQNPLLQALPRLALSAPPASRYQIRKADKPGQLSTLEATCHALVQLEQAHDSCQALLAAFDGFVAEQAGWMAPDQAGKVGE